MSGIEQPAPPPDLLGDRFRRQQRARRFPGLRRGGQDRLLTGDEVDAERPYRPYAAATVVSALAFPGIEDFTPRAAVEPERDAVASQQQLQVGDITPNFDLVAVAWLITLYAVALVSLTLASLGRTCSSGRRISSSRSAPEIRRQPMRTVF